MVIDADVARVARQFGIDAALIQAVVKAEGNILLAVRCSVPTCKDRQEALEITCRSAVHAMSDFVKATAAPAFVATWGARWCPVGAANDPHDTNVRWVPNVLSIWRSA